MSLYQAAEGTGLAFIVFTQAILKLTPAPFWSMIFFLMLLSLGLGSQIGIMEGMLCTIFDIDFFKRFSKPVLTGKLALRGILLGNKKGPTSLVCSAEHPFSLTL